MTSFLDPEQELAAHAKPDGILLVQARAGSGKTTVLKSRVSYILRYRDEHYQTASKLLVNAYNKDVAAEIADYFANHLSKDDQARVVTKTFHGIAMSMLFKFKRSSKVQGKIEIPKHGHLVQALQDMLSQRGVKDLKLGQVNAMLAVEGYGNARGIGLDDALVAVGGNTQKALGMDFERAKSLIEVMRQWRYQRGQLLFDDLLPLANALPAACFQQLGFIDVIADELQDLNFQQRLLTKNFVRYAESFTGLGDSCQSIMGFQGADHRIFEHFHEEYRDRTVRDLYITTTYRCAEPVVAVANKILERDLGQTVLMKGLGRAGPVPEVHVEGGTSLVRFLKQRYASGVEWKDMFVLYRTRKQTLELEQALAASDVPYVLANASFFEQLEIQDLFAYMVLVYDPKADYAYWRRLMRHYQGLGAYTAERTWEESQGDPFRVYASAATPKVADGDVRRRAGWARLKQVMQGVLAHEDDPVELAKFLKDELFDYWGEVSDTPEKLDERIENVNVFIKWLADFKLKGKTTGFEAVDAIMRYESGHKERDPDANAVRVQTLHSSKGLQNDTVAIWNVGPGTCPLWARSTDEVEAENRLLYVAATRAKNSLAFICPDEAAARGVAVTGYVPGFDPAKFLDLVPGGDMDEDLGKILAS